MRAKPDELKDRQFRRVGRGTSSLIDLAIDQDQVGLEMTVAMVLPVAGKCMIHHVRRQGDVVSQKGHRGEKVGRDRGAMAPLLLALVVSLELVRIFDLACRRARLQQAAQAA